MIPTQRRLPKGLRIRVGFFDPGKGREDPKTGKPYGMAESQTHFTLCDEVEEGDQVRYATNETMMRNLFEEDRRIRLADVHRRVDEIDMVLRATQDEEDAARLLAEKEKARDYALRVASAGYDPRTYKPVAIPIEFPYDTVEEVFTLSLARKSRSGVECECGHLRPKTPQELAVTGQQEALAAQELPLEPEPKERRLEYYVGECAVTQREEKTEKGRTWKAKTGTTTGTCDPLTCPHYRTSDDKKWPACLPNIGLVVRLPWSARRSWAWFYSRAWGSAAKLQTTLDVFSELCEGQMRGVPCVLCVEGVKLRRKDGRRTKPLPHVYVEAGLSTQQLQAHVQRRLAIGQGIYTPDALPAPGTVLADPRRQRALAQEWGALPEHVPSITFEDEWRGRAQAAGATSEWIDCTLENADGDENILESELAKLRGQPTPEAVPEETEAPNGGRLF